MSMETESIPQFWMVNFRIDIFFVECPISFRFNYFKKYTFLLQNTKKSWFYDQSPKMNNKKLDSYSVNSSSDVHWNTTNPIDLDRMQSKS